MWHGLTETSTSLRPTRVHYSRDVETVIVVVTKRAESIKAVVIEHLIGRSRC